MINFLIGFGVGAVSVLLFEYFILPLIYEQLKKRYE